jgi:hypothetical protein
MEGLVRFTVLIVSLYTAVVPLVSTSASTSFHSLLEPSTTFHAVWTHGVFDDSGQKLFATGPYHDLTHSRGYVPTPTAYLSRLRMQHHSTAVVKRQQKANHFCSQLPSLASPAPPSFTVLLHAHLPPQLPFLHRWTSSGKPEPTASRIHCSHASDA